MLSLKIARIKKGLNQEQLSKISGVGRPTISRLESGKQKPEKTKMEILIKLSNALGMTVKELFSVN